MDRRIFTCKNLVELLVRRWSDDGERPALWLPRDGAMTIVTWRQWAEDIFAMTSALADLGVQPGDRVAQISENRYEWLVADLAILALQAIHVPMHASLSARQLDFQIDHCAPHVVLLSGRPLVDRLSTLSTPPKDEQTPSVAIDVRYRTYDRDTGVIRGREAEPLAPRTPAAVARGLERVLHTATAATRDTPATILYTSGTTGVPRGVVLTHGNLLSDTQGILEAFGLRPHERRLCFLPLSHIYARTCDLYVWLVSGTEMALAASTDTVLADCQATQPTFLNGVPFFFSRVVGKLRESGRADQPGILRAAFGGRIEQCSCGGAPVPDALVEYCSSQGVALLPGYGLTEASPVVTASTVDGIRPGTVGRPLPGTEVQLADDGEILVRGPHIMLGYYRDPDASAEAVRDGWLHTGDLGEWDPDGFLKLTGRKKELLCTSTGKNVVPSQLESLLTHDPLIRQAAVFGEGRPYLTALIVPNLELVATLRREAPTAPTSHTGDSNDQFLIKLLTGRIAMRLHELSPHEQIRHFAVVPHGFALERDELTPKLSLRRHVIEEHYRELIEALYATGEPRMVNP